MSTIKKKCAKKCAIVQRPEVLRRYSAPTIYDQYPQGTECIVKDELLYVQKSTDENNPHWELQGPYKEEI